MLPILADVKCSVEFSGVRDRAHWLGDPFTAGTLVPIPPHLSPEEPASLLQAQALLVIPPSQELYLVLSYWTSGNEVSPNIHIAGLRVHEFPGTRILPLTKVTASLALRASGVRLDFNFSQKALDPIWKEYGAPDDGAMWLASRLAPGRWGAACRLLTRNRHQLYIALFTK